MRDDFPAFHLHRIYGFLILSDFFLNLFENPRHFDITNLDCVLIFFFFYFSLQSVVI